MGAMFRSLDEPWASTVGEGGAGLLTILQGVGNFERRISKARAERRRPTTKSTSSNLGCPRKLTDEQEQEARALKARGESDRAIAKHFGVANTTISRHFANQRKR